jgi:cell division protein FtsI (penicillin-binding protein 3)
MERPSNRRLTIVSIVVVAIVVSFAFRLVDVQLLRARKLDAESSQSLTVDQALTGDRGDITTSDGSVLAETVLRYDVTAAPVDAAPFTRILSHGKKTSVSVATAMSEVGAATGADPRTLSAALTAHKTADYVKLVTSIGVSQEETVAALHIPYLYLVKDSVRSYPDGAVAGNLVGFVGTSGAQAGLELQQNACLAGSNGSETYETGADGVVLPGSTTIEKKPVSGGTLTTTLNGNLQYLVQNDLATQAKALGAQSATAVVVQVSSGDLESVADWPSVDPNDVSGTAPSDLYSRAFTDLYEPGSTMKGLIAAALLNTGKATPTTQAVVPDVRNFPWGGTIHDAETHPVEHLTLTGILANSSNVGISLLGQDLTETQRFDYMREFGLGSPSAVDFPGEPTAPLKPVSQWDAQTDYNSMFGQGISATAIQMAGVYQTIADHGVKMPLTLVHKCKSSSGKVTKTPTGKGTRVVSASAADQVVQMLQSTLTTGTLSSMTAIPGYQLSAKSGTAQVADLPGGGYGDDFITSVAGMIPAVNPRYVVLVTMTKPSVDKTSAAVGPAFRQIATDVIQQFHILPSESVRANDPATW